MIRLRTPSGARAVVPEKVAAALMLRGFTPIEEEAASTPEVAPPVEEEEAQKPRRKRKPAEKAPEAIV